MARVKKLNPATGQKEWVTSTGTIERLGGDPSKQFSDYNFGTGKKASDTSTSGNPYSYVDTSGKTRTRTSASTPTASAPATSGKTYTYADKYGVSKTFSANSLQEALANRPADADPKSGVYESPTVSDTTKAQTSTTPRTFASTSASVRDREVETANSIKDALRQYGMQDADLFDINATKKGLKNRNNEVQSLISDRANALRARGQEVMSGINDSFNIAREKTEKTQERTRGKFSVGLAKIGGYLGASASSMGAMANLEQEHQFELADLEAKRASAILAAQDAENDAEFELAKMSMDQADKYEERMRQAEQDFFTNTMNLSKQIQAEQKEKRDFAIKEAERQIEMAVIAGEELDPEDVATAADALGISPNIMNKVISAKQQTYQLEQLEKKTDVDIKLMSALLKVPKGTYVSIGGNSYEGMDTGGTGSGSTKSGVIYSLIQDINGNNEQKRKITKSEALSIYGDTLKPDEIESYFAYNADANVEDKLASGAYDYATVTEDDEEIQFVYDKDAYRKALAEWDKEGSKRSLNFNTTIELDGVKYRGKKSEKPEPIDYKEFDVE